MKRADALRIVEAGYEWPSDDREWLAGVAQAASAFGVGSGTAAYCVDLSGKPRVENFVSIETRTDVEHEIHAFTHALSCEVAREVYSPTEFVGNAGYRVRRVARARNQTPERVTGGNSVATWALVGGDPRRRAVTLIFPASTKQLDPEKPFPRGRVLGLAAAHLGAALRLRRLAAPIANTDQVTESVLSPNGKVLHAVGAARDKVHRDSLVEAVVRRERARGRLRRVDPDEAANLWSVLVSWQW